MGYPWLNEQDARPVWLTAAVCYDATDLGLAADLRDRSDVFAIPAFNKDVKTFDQMALALHYHMFQLVIVANNGQYGGSNAGIVKLIECRLFSAFLHEAKLLNLRGGAIDNVPRFRSESG